MTRPETSIVIRTFNEERDLPRLLEAIHEQRYKYFEVIDVDSGSYDRTTAIAQEHGAQLLRINSRDLTHGSRRCRCKSHKTLLTTQER